MISLGCAKNLVDSEILMKQLEANSFEIVFDPTDTTNLDSAIVNTCGFIGDAKQESIDTILQLVQAKKKGNLEHVYVMGCLSERYQSQLQDEIPEVDAFFGVNDLKKIIRHIGGHYKNQLIGERKLTTPSHYAYLKIAEGCDRKCSFCAIPGIRGKHISRPVQDVLKEAASLASAGIRELLVISQDTTYYGLDNSRQRKLGELLSGLAAISEFEWIRLHYTYPDGFPTGILDIMRDHPNICRYIDIPLQHINNRILKSMHRGITGEETRELIALIRSKLPGVAIRTTFITGYPGETDKEFRELADFITDAAFERLGVFSYSHEEDTRAFRLTDSVPQRIKEQRVAALMGIQEEISLNANRRKIGSTMKVVIDREEGDFLIGRTEFDSPEVDNEVLIAGKEQQITPGSFHTARITSAESFDLYAELL
jgi:ribosomal protein S12 methylthiotransferase